jgi:site-specific DNA recombinase
MVKVAVYTRVSTEDQAREGYSLDAQKERLFAYCEAQGWELAEFYEENGHSGRNTRRPAYQRMMEERAKWDVILVMKMDRIHRNSKNFMIMMENLEKWGKKFTSMNESLDTSTAVGRFVVDIIQRIAQLESEQIGERTYMGMAHKAENAPGLLGFNPPFGYCIKDNDLSILPEEAEIVHRIFTSYSSGETMGNIALSLNREEILTRRRCAWTIWSIRYLLHNPAYAGFRRWDKILVPSTHEAIISREQFDRVQIMIRTRVKDPRHRQLVKLSSGIEQVAIPV